MDITLTPAEEALFTDSVVDKETVADAFHRLIQPLLAAHGEAQLQVLANTYRALPPEGKFEAIQLIKSWQAEKANPPLDETPVSSDLK